MKINDLQALRNHPATIAKLEKRWITSTREIVSIVLSGGAERLSKNTGISRKLIHAVLRESLGTLGPDEIASMAEYGGIGETGLNSSEKDGSELPDDLRIDPGEDVKGEGEKSNG